MSRTELPISMRPSICRAKPLGQIQTEPIVAINPQPPEQELKSKSKGKKAAPPTPEVSADVSNGQPAAVSQHNCIHPVVRIKIDRK